MKILFLILLSLSVITTVPFLNSKIGIHAMPVRGFKVTQNTLDHLLREGLPMKMIAKISILKNKIFKNRDEFVDALPKPMTTIHQEILIRYASTEQIKIQADEFTTDLKQNAAVFRGNVKGFVPRENIEMTTAKLRLVSGKDTNIEKMIGEGGVRVKQWDREIRSDFAIYTQVNLENFDKEPNDTNKLPKPQQTLQMKGNVIVKTAQGNVISDNVLLDLLKQHATLEGLDTSEEGRIRFEANLSDLETKRVNKENEQESLEMSDEKIQNSEPTQVVLLASRAVLDNRKRQAMFEGNVEMERTPGNLYIHAGKITLHLDESQELQFIEAVEEVCFEQPGRVAKADQASFDESTQTILLEGKAEVQSGQYHLQGNSINLYLDVNKGIAQGDNKAPIQMTVLGEQAPAIFACR
tara:strand:- start:506 stop:1735 length:1230 start_codon:yes stop_codon:yes gene_type:complete